MVVIDIDCLITKIIIRGIIMAETIDELTINYEEAGELKVKELDRKY